MCHLNLNTVLKYLIYIDGFITKRNKWLNMQKSDTLNQ